MNHPNMLLDYQVSLCCIDEPTPSAFLPYVRITIIIIVIESINLTKESIRSTKADTEMGVCFGRMHPIFT